MNIIKKIYAKYLKMTDPIKYSKHLGVTIGNECKIISSPNWGSEPWMIRIGNHSEISFGVTFITHDGVTWVFRNQEKYKDVVR